MKVMKIKVYEFKELNEETQNKVINNTIDFITSITNFETINKNTNFYKAYKKAEELQTPWFLGQYLWDYAKNQILKMCKQYYYFKDGEIFNY